MIKNVMVKNEWLVMYTDEYGYDMIMPFNTYEMALHFPSYHSETKSDYLK
jgi:hypothetical protein